MAVLAFPHPELNWLQPIKKLQTKMQPVYPSTEKLTNSGVSIKLIRNYIQHLLQQVYDGVERKFIYRNYK